LPDVDAVEVNFQAKTATVTSKPNRTIARAAVEGALQAAGYGVTTFDETQAAPAPGS
jgi:hypothetical protein